jgi:hypothetical protein
VPFRPNASLAEFFSTLDFNRYFSTSFAFCFSMREGMLILAGFQMVSAVFWLFATSQRMLGFNANWPAVPAEEALCIALLLCNTALIAYTVKRKSERGALALVGTFGATVLILLVAFSGSHPPSCANKDVVDENPLGA